MLLANTKKERWSQHFIPWHEGSSLLWKKEYPNMFPYQVEYFSIGYFHGLSTLCQRLIIFLIIQQLQWGKGGLFEPWLSLLKTPRSTSWELKGSWLCHRLIMILRNLYLKFYILKSSPTFQVERWHRQVNHKTFYWMRWCITLTYVSNLPGKCYHSTTQHDNLNTS